MIQAMGGIMSLTGPVDGDPCKVGVGIADVMCGMYACTAILAALHHREKTSQGQYIDIALLDSQLAWLVNSAQNYLTSGILPVRYGNGHPNIVPYETFPSEDGYFALAVGNDEQFRLFCDVIGRPELAKDDQYSSNRQRVANRGELIPLLRKILILQPMDFWLMELKKAGIPCGPVNDVQQVFSDPQIQARNMKITMLHADADEGGVDLIGNPVRFSQTPVSYRYAPPKLGQQTEQILSERLGLSEQELADFRNRGII